MSESIDDIVAGADTVMTASLKRLFKAAGCDPTSCHACTSDINEGEVFKLVSHKGTDEMCCAKHGLKDLKARDKKKPVPQVRHTDLFLRSAGTVGGGFSRPSKEPKP